jgi:exonuclease III
MGQFCRFLNDSVLKEIHLTGRLFTWSNERSHPTLERIDRAFMTSEWEDLFPTCDLQTLSSSCSDHAPLLLHTAVD